jgi:SAM-dependent methyltransferase
VGNEVAREFWRASNGQAFGTTLATDPAFEELNRRELAEIAGLLPALDGARVLELGAGIGRFTPLLAAASARVTVVDISPEAIKANHARNGALANVCYQVADVTSIDLGAGQFDFVFSNWLLMYLGDEEARALLARLARALSPPGTLFVRESCETNYRGRSHFGHALRKELLLAFLPPGVLPHATYNFWRFRAPFLRKLRWLGRSASLEAYRSAPSYETWFRDHFEVAASGHIAAYAERYGNVNQRYWLLRRAG